jgi:ribosomal subunit interface protein
MIVQFTYKHMPSSEALSTLAEEKLLAKISKFTAQPVKAHVTFSVEGQVQKMHVSLITSDGYDIEAEHQGADLYSEIDIVVERVEAQLRKYKERMKTRKGGLGHKDMNSVASAQASVDDLAEIVAEDAIDATDILTLTSDHRHSLQPVCGN